MPGIEIVVLGPGESDQPMDFCEQCGSEQVIVDAGHNSGFAGEGVYWIDFACGHQEFDAGEAL